MDRMTRFNYEKDRWEINTNHYPVEIHQEPGAFVPVGDFPAREFLCTSPSTAFLLGDVVDRLAAYENTNMSPEEYKKNANDVLQFHKQLQRLGSFKEFMRIFDADLRGQIPPCKIGDQVWGIRNYRGRRTAQCGLVSEMYYKEDMTLMVVIKHICRGEWGKDIFSSQKEAEEAIRAKEAKP